MFDTTLIINLAKHSGVIVAAAFILLAISPVRDYGIGKKSRINKIFLILFFGFFGIMGTYSGNQIFQSFANLRAMSVVTAGLYAGPVVGTGAGFVAAFHRVLIDPGGFSTIPCSMATFLEGAIAGFLSQRLGKYAMNWKVAAMLCFIGEGCHMGLVLLLSKPFSEAVALVEIIALPMMLANPIGAALFIQLIRVLFARKEERESIQAQHVLAIANETVGYFRAGLDESSAQKTARIVFDRLTVSAVAITDTKKILAHFGAGDDHHLAGERIRTMATHDVLLKGKPIFHRSNKFIGCGVKSCPFNSAIIVPLKKKNHIIGTLKIYGTKDISLDKVIFQIAQGLTELFSTQFELEDIQTKDQLLAHTRIRHLQAQINPHFLFNSLNTIASFCRTNPKKSRELILDLSSYMRKNLDSSRGLVKLSDELDHIHAYLAIEKARFGDRIQVNIDVDNSCKDWPVPPLIIQPLVENSIKHGILDHEDGGCVEIDIVCMENMLRVTITDDGSGMTSDQIDSIYKLKNMESRKEGVGLVNTNLRLEQIYGPDYRLEIKSEPGNGTQISFKIPLLVG